MNTITMKVEDIFDSPCVYEEITGQSRWSTHHYRVIEVDGKFYEWSYSKGSTEYQDNDFDYEDLVTLNEVTPHQVLTTVYKPVKETLNAVQ